MKSFSHANNVVLRRVIYIHNLPGVKLVKLFSLANEIWCAVTVPPFDFVMGDCAVRNAALGKKGYKLSTENKIYSRKFTNLTVVALSCKTTGKQSELTKSAAVGFFDDIRNVASGLYYSRKSVSDYCSFVACADTLR